MLRIKIAQCLLGQIKPVLRTLQLEYCYFGSTRVHRAHTSPVSDRTRGPPGNSALPFFRRRNSAETRSRVFCRGRRSETLVFVGRSVARLLPVANFPTQKSRGDRERQF